MTRASGENSGIAAAPMTVIVDVLLLLVAFGSGFTEETVAVLERGPGAEGRVICSAIDTVAPLAIVPTLHVTVGEPLHDP